MGRQARACSTYKCPEILRVRGCYFRLLCLLRARWLGHARYEGRARAAPEPGASLPATRPDFFLLVPSVHVHARHTQQLAEATAATHPSPDANPSRSQAHDNTYLSYSRNAIISTVAGGALVRQHARTRNLWCSSTP